MALENASATLTSAFIQVTKTGFINYQQGYIDPVSGTVKANGSNKWSNLSGGSWNDFTNYLSNFEQIVWTAPLIDLGAVDYFTLNIESVFKGTIAYIIHVSETGQFSGEETETFVQDGDTNVPGFYGRYIYVTARVTGTELNSFTINADIATREYILSNVNTSTLSGTSSNRTMALATPVSIIKDIHIQPKAATSYAVNLYVSDTATSEVLIPVIKSKTTSGPTFALYGIDNDPRDGIVDIKITALPRQVMFGGNLIVLA
jgi:hypothetical protein